MTLKVKVKKKIRSFTKPKFVALGILFLVVVVIAVYLIVQMILSYKKGETVEGFVAGLVVCYCAGSIIMLFIIDFPQPQYLDNKPSAKHVSPGPTNRRPRISEGSETHDEDDVERPSLKRRVSPSREESSSLVAEYSCGRERVRIVRAKDAVFNVNEMKPGPRRGSKLCIDGVLTECEPLYPEPKSSNPKEKPDQEERLLSGAGPSTSSASEPVDAQTQNDPSLEEDPPERSESLEDIGLYLLRDPKSKTKYKVKYVPRPAKKLTKRSMQDC